MYTLTLADGSQIKNLEMNGDSLISKNRVDESLFAGNLSEITISDGDTTEVRHNVEYTGQLQGPDGWYFSFAEIPAQQLVNKTVDGELGALASVLKIMMGVSDDDE